MARRGSAPEVVVLSDSVQGWRIQLLGSFTVTVDGVTVEAGTWRLRKAKSLVAMLALAPGQRCHREHVMDRLWPDLEPAAAARNLHQTLYIARRTVTGGGGAQPGRLSIRDEQVVLDATGPVEVDVLRFESSAQEALAGDDEAQLRATAGLYAGDLVPAMSDADWMPDADWLTARRERLRKTAQEISVKLATVLAREAPKKRCFS